MDEVRGGGIGVHVQPNTNKRKTIILYVIIAVLLIVAGFAIFKALGKTSGGLIELISNPELDIERAYIEDGNLNVQVQRNSKQENFTGIQFNISDGETIKTIRSEIVLENKEERSFVFSLKGLGLENVELVSVAPIYKVVEEEKEDSVPVEVISETTDTKKVSSSGGGGGGGGGSGGSGEDTPIVVINDEGDEADTISPYFTTLENQTGSISQALSYDINAADNVALGSFFIDDTTNFSINSSTGIITNISILVEHYYVVNITINDTTGNLNWSLWGFNVTTSSPTCSDGIQNQDETGIDCGGVCSACVVYVGITYYVSNTGSDSDDGLTTSTSWQTISHVNLQTFEPGDAILFKRGDVWRETLTVPSSGNSSGYITFGAYGSGDKPRILGSEPAVTWTNIGSNIWLSDTAFENHRDGGFWGDSYAEIFFESESGVANWGHFESSQGDLNQEFDYYWTSGGTYVYSPEDPATRYFSVEIPQRDSCIIFKNIQYASFDNLELLYCKMNGIFAGYPEFSAKGVRVTNSHIGYIGIQGGGHAYCISDHHSDALYQNNYIHDCGRRGISMNTYGAVEQNLIVSNIIIDNNYFANGYHTTGPDFASHPNMNITFRDVTISNNIFDDSDLLDRGINDNCAASSCNSNSIILEAWGNHYSDFYIYNNLFLHSTARAILVTGFDKVNIYHNTIVGSHPDALPWNLVSLKSVTNVDMRNNIIYGNLPSNVWLALVQNTDLYNYTLKDNNLYYHEIDSYEHSLTYFYNEDNIIPLPSFRIHPGEDWDNYISTWSHEINGIHSQNPIFVDFSNGNFNLQSNSPAINAGTPIALVTTDILGNPRDVTNPSIGAYEYVG